MVRMVMYPKEVYVKNLMLYNRSKLLLFKVNALLCESPRTAAKHRISFHRTVLNCKQQENLHSFTIYISRIVTIFKKFCLLEITGHAITNMTNKPQLQCTIPHIVPSLRVLSSSVGLVK